MKNNDKPITSRNLARLLKPILVAGAVAVVTTSTEAATVSGGALTLNLDRDAIIANHTVNNFPDSPTPDFQICCRPSMYVEEYFDANAANSRTFGHLLSDNTPDLYDLVSDEIPATDLTFSVNGSTAVALPPAAGAHYYRKTNFSFDPSDIEGTASGRIGLSGVLRMRIDVEPPQNRALVGDFDLIYDPEYAHEYDGDPALTVGRSDWVLVNNVGFPISGFYLFDVTTQIIGDQLTLTGELGLGDGWDHMSGIVNARVGTFNFTTTIVPAPSAVWLFGSGLFGIAANLGRKKLRG